MSLTNVKVIDDEKKTQELEANKDGGKVAQNKDAAWDAPYPEGVKKHKIRIPEGPEGTEGTEGKATTEEEDEKNNGGYKR